jgi:hypothetical protein
MVIFQITMEISTAVKTWPLIYSGYSYSKRGDQASLTNMMQHVVLDTTKARNTLPLRPVTWLACIGETRVVEIPDRLLSVLSSILFWSILTSSLLQIQTSGFDSRRYQIFWKVMGLERGPLSLVSKTEGYLKETVAAPV